MIVHSHHIGNYVNMLGYGDNEGMKEYLRLYIALQSVHIAYSFLEDNLLTALSCLSAEITKAAMSRHTLHVCHRLIRSRPTHI